ncbi:vacuolar fusion protein MON1 A [Thecamonas trahens ATCC 50062]|uniref:Vacuolar fusion protein MON1 A n=1 Tax=Thecamonas trahens ATCC 50062 TaxID=461836 RepID=A0A0L0DWF9_THETB|nr:vacuolar fusion protein MON1 A [Thecamonas trahens ATCC 50062]KNC55853.1 vacuolar fusion protein MON1 A [Thecamonas trahens ATCC 50062]|eukprot:XP_013752779.1 vacuolar fusion protein MON1 A [Thecamonas trahens ATCC 50062]
MDALVQTVEDVAGASGGESENEGDGEDEDVRDGGDGGGVAAGGNEEAEEETGMEIEYDVYDVSNEAIAARRRKHAHEEATSPGWTQHDKHVFILSSAGKPIYARYGDESRLSGFFGVLQAMISFVDDNDDELQHLVAGDVTYVFYSNGPLYYVCVARTREPASHLRMLLQYVHNLVVSVLTAPYIVRLFEQRPHFDLRRMLGGTEPLIDSLIELMDSDPSYLLGAAECLRLAASVRAAVGSALQEVKISGLLYALVIADSHLVTLVRPKSRGLHPIDLLLIMNFVKASPTLRNEAADSWTPFCLPHFNDTGHLHVYSSFLASGVCLLLISTEAESFHDMQACKDRVATEITAGGHLAAITDAMASQAYSVDELGIPGLLHFLYKSVSSRQYTAPAWSAPYITGGEQRRLLRVYQDVIEKVHTVANDVKIYYQVSQSETLLAWVTSSFELYVVFGPLVPKKLAIASCNKLLRWIKSQEGTLFILNSPVW